MAARIVYCYDNNKYEVGEIITPKREFIRHAHRHREDATPSRIVAPIVFGCRSLIPRQLSLSQCARTALAVMFGDEQQRLHRGLPFSGVVFCLWQFSDVFRGIA